MLRLTDKQLRGKYLSLVRYFYEDLTQRDEDKIMGYFDKGNRLCREYDYEDLRLRANRSCSSDVAIKETSK